MDNPCPVPRPGVLMRTLLEDDSHEKAPASNPDDNQVLPGRRSRGRHRAGRHVCSAGSRLRADHCDHSHGGASPCACDDANPCTADTCGAQGQCIHTTVACDDGNPCTGDSCNPASGCIATPLTGDSCDDGNACTLDDVCNNGACVAGGTVDCATANACYPSTCNPATGWCEPAPKVHCDDHNACTNDYCDPDVGCMFAPIICKDGDPRTVDSCNPATGCVFIPKTARPGASKGHAAGPQEVVPPTSTLRRRGAGEGSVRDRGPVSTWSTVNQVRGLSMKRVTGIGGIFFKAKDPKALAAWYERHLGRPIETDWGGGTSAGVMAEVPRGTARPSGARSTRRPPTSRPG